MPNCVAVKVAVLKLLVMKVMSVSLVSAWPVKWVEVVTVTVMDWTFGSADQKCEQRAPPGSQDVE
jgi:hypothetical protein